MCITNFTTEELIEELRRRGHRIHQSVADRITIDLAKKTTIIIIKEDIADGKVL